MEEKSDSFDRIPFRFTGKELDEDSGLYYYGARYLSSKTSRWLSADPLGSELVNPNRDGFHFLESLNWYSYAENNSIIYSDPNGNEVVHFDPYPGWSHDAPQKLFGYQDWMDDFVVVLDFNIHATKFILGDIVLRLWKGNYAIPIGGGGEIGFYKEADGRALTQGELSEIGLVSTIMSVHDKRDNSQICVYMEGSPSFWTTAFNSSKYPSKENIYTVNTFIFKTNERAKDFIDKLVDQIDFAMNYKHNHSEFINVKQYENMVIITWGKPEDNQ